MRFSHRKPTWPSIRFLPQTRKFFIKVAGLIINMGMSDYAIKKHGFYVLWVNPPYG